MCSIDASAIRGMLPGAAIAVDLFQVVQLAVKMTGDMRRRAVREKYGGRSRSGDAEYGIKGLLVCNLGHLRPEQIAKVIDTLSADRRGQQIAAVWIGAEKLPRRAGRAGGHHQVHPYARDVQGRLASLL